MKNLQEIYVAKLPARLKAIRIATSRGVPSEHRPSSSYPKYLKNAQLHRSGHSIIFSKALWFFSM